MKKQKLPFICLKMYFCYKTMEIIEVIARVNSLFTLIPKIYESLHRSVSMKRKLFTGNKPLQRKKVWLNCSGEFYIWITYLQHEIKQNTIS